MRRLLCITLLFAVAGCADHASSLRSKIGSAMADLDRETGDATKTITYAPTNKPYTIIFFPERRVFESDLIVRGVDPAVAKRIFHDLSRYGVGEKERPMLVVAEPGKGPAFDSYNGREIVTVENLIVVNKPAGGPVELTLQKRGETYYLTDVR